jgi:hypothetical protein
METTVTMQFVILSIHPENGKIVIDNTHLKYSLIGAVLLDFLDHDEISISNRRIIPSFRKNGDPTHDMFAEKIEGYSSPRRISRWVKTLSGQSWYVYKETVNFLIEKGIIRHERRLFLKIFPYNRFFHAERSIRTKIIDELRDVLLNARPATRKQLMLIGLINTSRSHNILVKEKGERWILRRKCKELIKGDVMISEIERAIQDVQAAESSISNAAMGA